MIGWPERTPFTNGVSICELCGRPWGPTAVGPATLWCADLNGIDFGRGRARVAESVDALGLNPSAAFAACGFESRSGHWRQM